MDPGDLSSKRNNVLRPQAIMISVVVLTLNEELNLPRCLEAISWCDDVLIVDSFSSDATLKIAAEHRARVVQRPFDSFAGQRNFAVERCELKHEWVFHLDADEVITPGLAAEIRACIGSTDKHAYRVSSKLIFDGKFLRHAGLFPWYQVRLGRRGKLRFKQVGHGQREQLPSRVIGTLKNALLHFPFEKGLEDWIEKHKRYSAAEARQNVYGYANDDVPVLDLFSIAIDRRRRAAKKMFRRLPCRATIRFIYMYLFRSGILDGKPGFTYCRLLAWYEWLIVLKERELKAHARGKTLQ
jgi:glycosyltransferase involved in cell wall biosynthesis